MSTLLLIRHAESAAVPEQPESEWPLTDHGVEQAVELVLSLGHYPVTAFYASPYRRAVATLQPLAEHLHASVSVVPDLRERRLAGKLMPDWRERLEASWADFDLTLPGGESARECQRRVVGALEGLVMRHPDETIAACSHGNAIALFLNAIDASVGFAAWASMKNPHIFTCRPTNDGWVFDG